MAFAPYKPWLSFADQVIQLKKRGLFINDDQDAEFQLAQIGYYRLSGYFYPFRERDNSGNRSNNFVAGTQFDHILALYHFDTTIKLLALEAMQYIEIALRVQIAYALGKHNAIAHTQSRFFNPKFKHQDWLDKYQELLNAALNSEKKDKKHIGFVLHNVTKYGGLPIWVACELWDFGAMSRLFQGMQATDRDGIAKIFHLSATQLESHLQSFNFVRNVAAHHGRLWNRNMIGRPKFKKLQGQQWQLLDENAVFVVFCLMQSMLQKICPQSDWKLRFQQALALFPQHNAAMNEVNLNTFGIHKKIDLNRWNLWR